MGHVHAQAYQNIPNVEVVYIYGRTLKKAEELAQAIGATPTTNITEILADQTIEAVDVCVPSPAHHEFVIPALEAGKHVFCETPFALTLENAEAMQKAARDNNRLLLVGLLMRSIGGYRYIKKAVDAGELGELRAIYAYRLGSYLRPNSPEHTAHYGDPTTELMTFDYDFLNWLMGLEGVLSARATFLSDGLPSHILAMLQYGNVIAEVEASGVMPVSFPYSIGLRVVGDKQTLVFTTTFEGDGAPKQLLMAYPDSGKARVVEYEDGDPYQAECQYFIDCTQGKADPELLSAERAVEALRLSLATKELVT